MTDNQQEIINKLNLEISQALACCEYNRNEQGGDVDKIDAHISSYTTRVKLLRDIRNQLENEFTIIHYNPR